MKKYLFIAVLMVMGLVSFSQKEHYEKKLFIQDGDTLPYRIMYPIGYHPSGKYPLVLVLHGAGERGNDNEKQLVHGSGLFASEENRRNFPAIVIFLNVPPMITGPVCGFRLKQTALPRPGSTLRISPWEKAFRWSLN